MLEKMKPSRWTARRNGISGIGQSRLQVKTAVKIQTKAFPDRMRKLHKATEAMAGKGKIQVSVRHLQQGQLDDLMVKTGLPEEEIHSLYLSFTRYDIDDSGYLDRAEVRQVLCDLGLQPRGCEEKVEVHEIICDSDSEGLRHHNFDEFVFMVKAVRERLQQIQLGECMLLFEDADIDGNMSLSIKEVMDILARRLHMIPRTPDEIHEVSAIFQTCDVNGDNNLGFEEFQEFIQKARAKMMMLRREEELTIAKAFVLHPDIVTEFRMDLPQLWAVFGRYDRRGQSMVSRPDLFGLLIDVGICPVKTQAVCEQFLEANLVNMPTAREETDFPKVLKMVHELRTQAKMRACDDLLDRFHTYDRHKLGQLHYSDVYQILADFKMLPKSREEQHGIVTVIERLDTDGSGSFDFEEFQDFFQRLTEQVQMTEREQERQMILAMGFTENHLHVLRNTFFSLNPSPLNGKIQQIGLVSAVSRTRDVLCPNGVDEPSVREITRTAQQAPDKGISFQEFAQSLRSMNATKEDDAGDD